MIRARAPPGPGRRLPGTPAGPGDRAASGPSNLMVQVQCTEVQVQCLQFGFKLDHRTRNRTWIIKSSSESWVTDSESAPDRRARGNSSTAVPQPRLCRFRVRQWPLRHLPTMPSTRSSVHHDHQWTKKDHGNCQPEPESPTATRPAPAGLLAALGY